MKVAINTRLLLKNNLDGIGRFSYEIIKRIVKQNPKTEFHLIFDRNFSKKYIFSKNVHGHVLSPPTRHPILWFIWFQFKLPLLLKKINPDVFYSPDGFTSTRLNGLPSVVTIHDINFEHRPDDLNWLHSLYYRTFFQKFARISTHITTVSNFSKIDIIKKYSINEKKISVVYNSVSEKFKPANDKLKSKTRERYSSGKNFFLFVGSLHKRKNLKNLLLAFDGYRINGGQNKLLIIGKKKWWDHETEKVFKKLESKNHVKFLGRVSDNEMINILASAKALCFVSFFEGFGLPILEAMKCETPVICSNTSAMPEVSGNASILVNPNCHNEITNAMLKIDSSSNSEMIAKGILNLKRFDWYKSAEQIFEILLKAKKNGY